MRKRNAMKKTLCLAALLGAFALGSMVAARGGSILAQAEGSTAIEFSDKVESLYNLGESITLPQGSVTVDGQQYEADCILYCPDGTATNRREVVLSMSGEYVLEYVASVGGKYYTEKKTFTVTNEIFSVDGQGYVTYDTFNGKMGAVAHMQDGDRLVFNQVVNLAHFDDTEELFRMFAIPQSIGQEDFARFEVEIQDIYDADKTITIEAKQYLTTGNHRNLYTYNNVKVGNGIFIGLEERGNTIEFEGKKYSLHRGDQYGCPIRYSFTGKQAGVALGDEWIGFCYGYENNVVRVKNQTTVLPIADLDNSQFLTDIFTGFTTGEVCISIKPTNYVRSSCNVFISHFAGKAVTENSFFVDNEKPDLQVDFGGYEESNLPVAAVGMPYKVFDSSAFDVVDGVVETSYRVYYGYNSENKISVDVVDGAFTPAYAGPYTIQYTAKDRSGNTATKAVQIRAYDDLQSLALTASPAQSLEVGEKQKAVEEYSILNAVGNATISAVATLRSDPNVQYVLDSELYFTPLYSGEYDVTIRCSDYYQTVEVTQTINVQGANKVLFLADGIFPTYLLKNGVYEFPVVTALDLSSGKPISAQTQLFIIEDAGEELAYSYGNAIGASDNVVLRYKYSDTEYYDVPVPVVVAGLNSSRIYVKDYFLATKGSFDVNATLEGIDFTIAEADSGAVLTFINPLDTATFSLSIRPAQSKSWSVGTVLSVYIRDGGEESVAMKFTYRMREDGVYVSANNGAEYYVCATFDKASDVLSLVYSAKKGTLVVNERLTILTPTNLQGEGFSGFSNPVKMTIDFEAGFAVGDGICIYELNKQKISSSRYDEVAASLVHNNAYYGEKRLNDVVTIYPCYAYDVLTPDVKAYIKVTAPDGSYARDVNGVLLDGTARADVERQLCFTQYGQYDFVLLAYDAPGTEISYSFTAYVIKMEQPIVTVGNSLIHGEVGKAVTLASYTISGVEDLSKCTVFVTVKNPNNCIEYLGAVSHYTPSMRGEYVVHVCVLDEYGNLGEATYTLMVS